MSSFPKYSVLMSVYKKEKPEWFSYAIDSMLNQTIKPSEFVIVCDGPLTKGLDKVIEEKQKKNNKLFKIVCLKKNAGLGPALARGVNECSNEFIARMDSDDYCKSDRVEKQFAEFNEDPTLGLVGTNVEEFNGDIKNVISHVVLPETNEQILAFSKKRCPFRHPSLLYKKSAVLKAGNYRKYHLFEDYDIYVRMIETGCKCKNIQEPLTYMRINDDFYKRRGGLKYAKSILRFKNEQLRKGYFNFFNYLESTIPHIAVCFMPNKMRDFTYRKFLRG